MQVSQNVPGIEISFYIIDIGNNKSAKTNIFYINDFKSLLTIFLKQSLSVNDQIPSAFGGLDQYLLLFVNELTSTNDMYHIDVKQNIKKKKNKTELISDNELRENSR